MDREKYVEALETERDEALRELGVQTQRIEALQKRVQYLETMQGVGMGENQMLRARVQLLVDDWPKPLEDKGYTFPDGEFWAQAPTGESDG